ncbi:MAG: family 20 glycosylhydrolase [Acidobacteriota bacterium]
MRHGFPQDGRALALILFLIFSAAAPAGASDSGGGVLGLMPVPETVKAAPGYFRVDENLAIASQGPASPRAFRAAARFMSRLSGRTGLFLKQDYLADQAVSSKSGIVCRYRSVGLLRPNENESYSLEVKPEGVSLTAETDLGILRGLETLLQLLAADQAGYAFPCVEIRDKPRFTWRGLLIDCGRHFQPLDVLKRNLDAMAAVKMNVLHWHLTEDQGFPLESKTFPKLTQLGSDGKFYTQAQVREVIEYAADRGIRVVPEFDIPGHSTSWLVAYPEFAAAPGPYAIERHFGVFGPAFDPSNEKIYGFFDKFFKEMAALFPDPYMHIGGDEVNPDQWNASRAIAAFKNKNGLADNHALQAYFNRRILKILTKYGKRMVGWDEIFQPGLPTDIVIHSWRGTEALFESARKGYQGILSNGYYIDLCRPASDHYAVDPIPADSSLTEAQKALILGGEATMWSEIVSPETIDSRIWPRTAAIAERLWSPASVDNVEDMYRRLAIIEIELEEAGLTHLKNRDMFLRRLAGTADIEPLKILAEAVEPLKNYKRHSQGVTYSTLAPLTRFVDACPPESLPARSFRTAVDGFLEGRSPALAAELKATLSRWKDNHPRVLPLIAAAPALREIETLSLALESIAAAGLEALDVLTSGQAPEKGWLESSKRKLTEAGTAKAECESAAAAAVGKLIEACGANAK